MQFTTSEPHTQSILSIPLRMRRRRHGGFCCMSSVYVEGGRPQGLQHVNGEALAGSGLCHLPIRPNQVDILFALPEEGFTHPPDSSGIVGEEAFTSSGGLRWRWLLVPRHMHLWCGQHPPRGLSSLLPWEVVPRARTQARGVQIVRFMCPALAARTKPHEV